MLHVCQSVLLSLSLSASTTLSCISVCQRLVIPAARPTATPPKGGAHPVSELSAAQRKRTEHSPSNMLPLFAAAAAVPGPAVASSTSDDCPSECAS